jgi:hypothetical protein
MIPHVEAIMYVVGTVVTLAVVAVWLIYWSSKYPSESFWEIYLNGPDQQQPILICTCCCRIGIVIQIVDALNAGQPIKSYSYKRSGG